MTKEALDALRRSIKHWEENVEGKTNSFGPWDCALCGVFGPHDCKGCPVMKKTSGLDCQNTPWEKLNEHVQFSHYPRLAGKRAFSFYRNCPTCRELAREEYDFLVSLLPKEGEKP